jgi:YD repeat-containing protein
MRRISDSSMDIRNRIAFAVSRKARAIGSDNLLFRLILTKSIGRRYLTAFGVVCLMSAPTSAIAANAAPSMVIAGQSRVSPSGAFTYTIPIAVPPGTGGMSPSLSLDYSSQSGDGLEGLGWMLNGLPSIGRCPRTIAQDGVHGSVNYDANDRFCMEGQRLVLITPGGTYGASGTEYRTDVEGFSKIIAHGTVTTPGVGPMYFEVHTKAGQIMYFGYNEDTDNSSNNSRLSLSMNNPTVRVWAVERVTDTKGNYFGFKYTIDTKVIGTDTQNIQARPTEIDYTGNDNSHPVLAPYASVKFQYEDRATAQIIPSYQAGYMLETTKLVQNVQTFVGTTMITSYNLAYNTLSGTIVHYELASITQCDNSTPANCLKPTSFGWQGSRNALTLTATTQTLTNGATISSGDFNGDGVIDLVSGGDTTNCNIYFGPTFATTGLLAEFDEWFYDGEEHTYYTNPHTGKACFTGLGSVTPSATGSVHGLVDINGDGVTDVLLSQRVANNTFELFPLINQSGGALVQVTVGGTRLTYPVQTDDIGDFNGDGLTDVVTQNSPDLSDNHLYIGDGTGRFSCSSPCTGYDPNDGYAYGDFDGDGCSDIFERGITNRIVYSFLCNPATPSVPVDGWLSSSVALGDFNGDGKIDILVAPPSGQAVLYLSTGKGLAPGITLSGSEFSDWGKYSIYVGDWNGDGMVDVLLVAPGQSGFYGPGVSHKIYLSTGNGFVQASGAAGSIANTNPADTNVTASVADWNNDGASDIWLQRNGSGDSEYTFSYLPELMVSVDNGISANTIVTYAPLNQNSSLYQKCPSTGTFFCGYTYPDQAVDGALYVVQRIDSSNAIGPCAPPTNCYSSTYAYGQAKIDLSGRGFLGFQTISVTDLQTNIIQTTTYATDFPSTGYILSQTRKCPALATGCPTGGVLLNSTQNTYDIVDLGVGSDGVKREFVALQTSTVASSDLDGTPMPTVVTTNTYDCDTLSGGSSICAGYTPTGFGNTTQFVAHNLTDGATKTTINTYTNDTTNWYLGRLLKTTIESVNGSSDLTRQTTYCYELSYVPAGTSCATTASPTGLLSQEITEPQTVINPNLQLETDYTYDVFGNKASSISKGCIWLSSTNCSTTAPTASRELDTRFDHTTNQGQFLTKSVNALSQAETNTYTDDLAMDNSGFGVPSSHTGPNGLTTSWKYDTFGRKILEVRPDGNQTAFGFYYCTNSGCAGLPTGITSVHSHTHFIVVATPEDSTGTQNGPITVSYYDALSRFTGSDVEGFDGTGTGCNAAAPCWIRVETQFDDEGHPYHASRAYFLATGSPLWTTNSYDVMGRVYLTVQPGSVSTSYGFDGLTNTVTNDKGQVSTTIKNPEGLVASVRDNESHTTSYVYDAFGDLLKVTDLSGNITQYTYDIRGRKLTASDPDMGNWFYVYDAFGELYKQTDAKSQISTLTYDALGRMLTRTEADLASTWTYDTAAGKGVGQLASATTASGYMRTPA